MLRPLAIATAALGAVACTSMSTTALASEPAAPAAAQTAAITYTLPDLPYAYDALEGAIDAKTMEIHHGKHHAAYVNNLNAALASEPALAAEPLETLMAKISTLSPAIRNNGGGHYNHSLFWKLMAPAGQGGTPSAELAADIDATFGSMDAFKEAFNKAATGQFGSGWAWLVMTDDGLKITSTPNQDNPLMDVAAVKGAPILAVDVWEHAYYLQYQNRRADYLNSWWDVVNWNEANSLYAAAK
ncbi:MAG: superoxide dismutase [Hyphomonas sp.]|uniref:superoxide dismutase n=1 Tax=Hyphomonas sp. TaxID=87 RepID=UPI001D6C787F|nr:superoxide dismutase [Hyphomonas sp.]MBA4225633.1 superoxide dismutase [Hyphomonas sp.]